MSSFLLGEKWERWTPVKSASTTVLFLPGISRFIALP